MAEFVWSHLASVYCSLRARAADRDTLASGLLFFPPLYVFGLIVYRLWLSPIARFPGPKLAAATGLYETYYDVVHQGRWVFKVEQLHETYGREMHFQHLE